MKDLSSLELEIENPKTRALLSEAISCYQAGAHRASLVSLWIAVAVDLIHKLRYLADSGANDARQHLNKLDTAIRDKNVGRAQEFERKLLDECENKFNLLTHRESEELRRLKTDRDLCAHPGFIDNETLFEPCGELVRSHIIAAHRATFSHPPIAGKAQLDLMEKEIISDGWPDDENYFVDRFYRRSRESTQFNLCKLLVKWSLMPPEKLPEEDPKVGSRARSSACSLSTAAPRDFERALNDVLSNWETSGSLDDTTLVRAVGAYGSHQIFWDSLPETAEKRLSAVITTTNDSELFSKGYLVGNPPLKQMYRDRWSQLIKTLDADQLAMSHDSISDHEALIQRALVLVEASGSFRDAEKNLRTLELFAKYLDRKHIEQLFQAIKNNKFNQVRLAADTEAILISIFDQQKDIDESRDTWRSIADWLSERGAEDSDNYYLYSDLSKVVNDLDH